MQAMLCGHVKRGCSFDKAAALQESGLRFSLTDGGRSQIARLSSGSLAPLARSKVPHYRTSKKFWLARLLAAGYTIAKLAKNE